MKCPDVPLQNKCFVNLLLVLRYLNFEKYLYIHVIHWKVYLTKVLCFHMFHVFSFIQMFGCVMYVVGPVPSPVHKDPALHTICFTIYRGFQHLSLFLSPWRLPNHWKTRCSKSHNYVLNMDCGNCRMRTLLSFFFQMNIFPNSWENYSSLDNHLS
jgi:hypothetical protein